MRSNEKIINMLHWKQPSEIQEQGIKLAVMEEDLEYILYYSLDSAYGENCAKISTSKSNLIVSTLRATASISLSNILGGVL